jgi:hypothetical protein
MSYQSDESELIVSISGNFDTSADTPGGPDWAPVVAPHFVLTETLSSAYPMAIYDVSLVLEVNLADGSWQLDDASKDEEEQYLLAQIERTTFNADVQAIMHGRASWTSIELNPDGDLLVSRHSSVTERPHIFLLKGPVQQGTAASLNDDRLQVVASGVDGELLSAILSAESDDTSWRSLGLDDVRSIASAQSSDDGAHIVAQKRTGELMHAVHRPGRRTEWTQLAQHVRSFATITSSDTEISIVAVHDDGAVAQAILTEHTARWQSIGSTRPGELSAALHPEDRSLSILIEDDRNDIRLLGLPDHTSPAGPVNWRELGTRDQITARLLRKANHDTAT